jgi:SAM-dependent methyltransferase
MLVARRLYASHTARVACRAMTVPHPLSLRTMAFITPIPATKQPIAPLGARLPLPLATRTSPARRAASGVACRSYASPEVYDIAFSFRDFESEVAFLLEAQATHGTGPLSRFLEVGCGPARHCTLLASAANTTCVGLDASQEMIDYATQRAQREGVTDRVAFMQGDMAAPGGWAGEIPGGPVDMAAVLLGTLCHCLDNAAALQCFCNLAE